MNPKPFFTNIFYLHTGMYYLTGCPKGVAAICAYLAALALCPGSAGTLLCISIVNLQQRCRTTNIIQHDDTNTQITNVLLRCLSSLAPVVAERHQACPTK